MARINLKQNEGVRTSDQAAPVTNPHSDFRFAGISAMSRASDNLANSIAYVGRAVGDIAKDQLRMKNEIAVNSAQIDIAESEIAFNENMLKRMNAGEFKDFETFKNAYVSEYAANIEKPLNEKYQKEGLSDSARHSLAVFFKKSQATNFARMGGEWMRSQNAGKINQLYVDLNRLGDMNASKEDYLRTVSPFVNGGIITKETAEKIIDESWRKRTSKLLDLEVRKLQTSSSPEEFDKNFEAALNSQAYKNSGFIQKQYFDVFSSLVRARLIEGDELKKQKKAVADYKAKREATEDSLNALSSEVEIAVFANEELVKSSDDLAKLTIDREGTLKASEAILADSNFSEEEKTLWRAKILRVLDEAKAENSRRIKRKLKNGVFENLQFAVENNGGKLDSNMPQGPEILQKQRAAELVNASMKSLPYLEENAKDILSKDEFETYSRIKRTDSVSKKMFWGNFYINKSLQTRKYAFDLMKRAYNYDFAKDETGTELASMINAAQALPEAQRQSVMTYLYNSSRGISPNEKWSAADVKLFDKAFSEVCDIGRDTAYIGDNSDPILYQELRNRVFLEAQVENLTLKEAIDKLKEDFFYQRILHKKSRDEALKFVNKNSHE